MNQPSPCGDQVTFKHKPRQHENRIADGMLRLYNDGHLIDFQISLCNGGPSLFIHSQMALLFSPVIQSVFSELPVTEYHNVVLMLPGYDMRAVEGFALSIYRGEASGSDRDCLAFLDILQQLGIAGGDDRFTITLDTDCDASHADIATTNDINSAANNTKDGNGGGENSVPGEILNGVIRKVPRKAINGALSQTIRWTTRVENGELLGQESSGSADKEGYLRNCGLRTSNSGLVERSFGSTTLNSGPIEKNFGLRTSNIGPVEGHFGLGSENGEPINHAIVNVDSEVESEHYFSDDVADPLAFCSVETGVGSSSDDNHHHDTTLSDAAASASATKKPKRKYPSKHCDYCGLKFRNQVERLSHMGSVHNVQSAAAYVPPSAVSEFVPIAKIPKLKSKTGKMPMVKLEAQNQQIMCQLCPLMFTYQVVYEEHLRVEHQVTPDDFPCGSQQQTPFSDGCFDVSSLGDGIGNDTADVEYKPAMDLSTMSNPKPRREFKHADRVMIIRALLSYNGSQSLRLGGNEIWKHLVTLPPFNDNLHTWSSMREHFLKKIFPHLETFGLTDEEMYRLRTWKTYRAPRPPKPKALIDGDALAAINLSGNSGAEMNLSGGDSGGGGGGGPADMNLSVLNGGDGLAGMNLSAISGGSAAMHTPSASAVEPISLSAFREMSGMYDGAAAIAGSQSPTDEMNLNAAGESTIDGGSAALLPEEGVVMPVVVEEIVASAAAREDGAATGEDGAATGEDGAAAREDGDVTVKEELLADEEESPAAANQEPLWMGTEIPLHLLH